AVRSAPRFAPSSLNRTPATRTLSVTLAVTNTVPLTVVPAAGAVRATVGRVVSLEVPVTVTVRLAVPTFPTASRALTVRTFAPSWSTIQLVLQLLVPAAIPLPPRLCVHVTWVTPMLSAAVPRSVSDRTVVV